MKFRIKEYQEGFVVEVEKNKWYGKRWVPYILASGIDEPRYHKTYNFAEMNLLQKIKFETIINSTYKNQEL